jgi:hypothetical protein
MRHAKQERHGRYYICKFCQHGGGTLVNTGDRENPVYAHDSCKKRHELLVSLGLSPRGRTLPAPPLVNRR